MLDTLKAVQLLDRFYIFTNNKKGYLSKDCIAEAAELVGILPAEAIGMSSFYEMFKHEPSGKYSINICQGISCYLSKAEELIQHCEKALNIQVGQTTEDGMFSLQAVECIAACSEAPCLQTNYRYHYKQTPESFDELINQLKTDNDIPHHGTLSRVQQDDQKDDQKDLKKRWGRIKI